MIERKIDLILCAPRGFCAGVSRAIDTVEMALKKHGAPVYVRRDIVHNKHVVESFRRKGAVFVEELDEVPMGDAPVVFSAHGVSTEVESEARRRGLRVIDAVCPLVRKIHHEARSFFRNGYEIVLIGHAGHPEVIGTIGQLPEGAIALLTDVADAESFQPKRNGKLAFLAQTTLSVDEVERIVSVLRTRFPHLVGPRKSDICYATTNRQAAVKIVAPTVDAMIVIGSSHSSNSQRLKEVSIEAGCTRTILIEDAASFDWNWLADVERLGLTAGASVPEQLVLQFLTSLGERFFVSITPVSTASEEGVSFPLPKAIVARNLL